LGLCRCFCGVVVALDVDVVDAAIIATASGACGGTGGFEG
jgi:hypothetical protein